MDPRGLTRRPVRTPAGSFILAAFLLLAWAYPAPPELAYYWGVQPAPGVHHEQREAP